jgi:hypothetical protein
VHFVHRSMSPISPQQADQGEMAAAPPLAVAELLPAGGDDPVAGIDRHGAEVAEVEVSSRVRHHHFAAASEAAVRMAVGLEAREREAP